MIKNTGHNQSDDKAGGDAFPVEQIYVKRYRCLLNEIPQPPDTLFIRGNAELLNSKRLMVCIIGSRKHTQYGESVVKSLIGYLAPYNPIIISGLATGIDTLALQYAVEKDLACIAVLGSGINDNSIYPRENISLAHIILNKSGLLISEYPPGTRADKWRFPVRNRIMAGLAKAIIIVEGGKKSGTLITARLGLDFNRDIICIPGSIFSELSGGPLSLIQHGAIPLTHPSDILEVLELGTDDESLARQSTLHDEAHINERYSRCTTEERMIIDALLYEPLDRNDLLIKTGYEIQKLQVLITTLEVKGFIIEKYGKIVRL